VRVRNMPREVRHCIDGIPRHTRGTPFPTSRHGSERCAASSQQGLAFRLRGVFRVLEHGVSTLTAEHVLERWPHTREFRF